MSATPTAAAPAKSKKMLVIILGVVLLLVLAGGGAAAWLIKSRSSADLDDEGLASAASEQAPKVPPTYLALENMVVNLADPGGDRFAQIGVTLEVEDAKTADQVKLHLPTIRSGILMLISQRESSELLQREGKEKLAADILREVSTPLGFAVPASRVQSRNAESDEPQERPRRSAARNPVKRVLFSSFIIQ